MALTVTIFEAVWTTTTTPKTVSVTGAVAGDWIAVIAGGDQSSGNGVTAVTSSTTGGSTTAWTELAEDLDSGTSVDWYHAAKAQVTADGTVTVQVDRTKTGAAGGEWGFFAVLGHGCVGVNLLGELGTAGATEAINGTVSANSAVAFAEFDWEPQAAAAAWTPAGQTVIEATQFADVTVAAAYWTGQAAGTRNYGTTDSTSATIKAVAVELLEDVVSPTVPLQLWPSRGFGPWPRIQLEVLAETPPFVLDDPPAIPAVVVTGVTPTAKGFVAVSGGTVSPTVDVPPRWPTIEVDTSRAWLPTGFIFVGDTPPEAAVPQPPTVVVPQRRPDPGRVIVSGNSVEQPPPTVVVSRVPQRLPEPGRVFIGSTPVEPPVTPTDTSTAAVISVAPRIPQPAFIYHTHTFQDTPVVAGETPTRTVMSVPVGPRPAGSVWLGGNNADTGAAAVVDAAPKPVITVGQAPRTAGVQFVQRGFVEDSGRVSSVVVTPQTRPAAGNVWLGAGRADPPAPLPPTPTAAVVQVWHPGPTPGVVITGHGFATALPVLFDGTVVGGVLSGPQVSGGGLAGYVTGGLQAGVSLTGVGAVASVDDVYSSGSYGEGIYPGYLVEPVITGGSRSGYVTGGRR